MRKWRQNAKMLTALKTLARMGVFKNSCETAVQTQTPRPKHSTFNTEGPEASWESNVVG
jgi:hypothetical protein